MKKGTNKIMGQIYCNVLTGNFEVIEEYVQIWLADIQVEYKKFEIISITQSQNKEDVTITIFWK